MGKLDIEAPVRTYLPELRLADEAVAARGGDDGIALGAEGAPLLARRLPGRWCFHGDFDTMT
jgi:hypothetical protein